MKQPILILGASGFIGKRLTAALAASDWARPIAASRRPTASSTDLNVEKLAIDATDATALTTALQDVHAVVNCIAGDAATIVNSARTLFAALARQSPPPRVVHLSSLAAYGSATGVIDESAPLLGDLDAYSAAKADVEQLARQRCASAVMLRPGIVYGPDSPWWSDRIARLLLARRLGNIGNDGEGFCNLVHVDDVVSAVIQAIRLPNIEGKAFNLSMPSPPTWNQYFTLYGSALGIDRVTHLSPLQLTLQLKVFALPLKALESIAIKLQQAPTPPLRPWLIKLSRQRIALDVSMAETQLGMRWIPLTTGLQQAASWFLAGGRT